MSPDALASPLDAAFISAASACVVECRELTHSTNDDARSAAAAGAAHGTAILADEQTAGRGRRGAVWHAAPGRNFLGSVILRPQLPQEKWPRLTHACALAVCRALEEIPGCPEAQIKWPNDIFLSGKKVCGILVEGVLQAGQGCAIAGIGVNLNMTAQDIPQDLRATATSVFLENGGRLVDRNAFAISLLRRLQQALADITADPEPVLQECNRRSLFHGRQLTMLCGADTRTGLFCGLGPEGELLLKTERGVEEISSADLVRMTDA